MVCGLLSHAWHPQTSRTDVTLAAARLVWLFLLFLRANIGVSQAFLLVKRGISADGGAKRNRAELKLS